MEPRPQRPRTVGGQPQPQLPRGGGSGGAPTGQAAAAGAASGGYPPEGADPPFIAPSRAEYDYNPPELGPPRQRRGPPGAPQHPLVAESAARETAAAGGVPASPDASPPPAESGGEATQESTERRVATGAGSGDTDEALPPEQLKELLPDEGIMPEGLTESSDNERSLEEVV